MYGSVLQCVLVCGSVLREQGVHLHHNLDGCLCCSVLQCVAVCCRDRESTYITTSTAVYVAACCSVWQCVAGGGRPHMSSSRRQSSLSF